MSILNPSGKSTFAVANSLWERILVWNFPDHLLGEGDAVTSMTISMS